MLYFRTVAVYNNLIPTERAAPMNERVKKLFGRILYILAIILLIAVFLFCAWKLIKYYSESQKSKKTYQQLQDLRDDYSRPVPTSPSVPDAANATEPTTELVTVTDPVSGESVQVLPELAELYVLNPDLVGWLTIPETNVDYPVVQRPEDVDYYLYRDFYGNHDAHGCLYAREQCDVAAPSDNITIYGHRMNDQTMFAHVGNYEKKSFWEEHPYLFFDTLTERHTYQIISVFVTSATAGQGFQYHLFVDAADQAEFDDFIATCKAYSIYDTGLTAQYGDKLLTLSTCEYGQKNGRLVVVAKRID